MAESGHLASNNSSNGVMMARKLLRVYGSFRGRIERSTFWWSAVALGAAFVVLFVFLDTVLGRASTFVLYPPLFWGVAALAVKRMHDRGASAWWLLVALVPIAGPLWLFYTLALRAGSPGENQYGDDPRLFDADYLTVR
jgi:uncharacterized membrane protein YhaH (DUF805 family)